MRDMDNLSTREMGEFSDQVCGGCLRWFWRCECPEGESPADTDGQAPVVSETRESARERIPTAPDGVPVSMAEMVGGCLR